ncbi:MAG: MbnP family protein [Aquaticitalea sp.]
MNAQTQSLQKEFNINVDLQFDQQDIKLGEPFISANNDTLSFNTIKFYLSGFEIEYVDASTSKEKISYHLIDIDIPESLHIPLKVQSNKEIKLIRFNIGVDSLASVSGAMDGDLDATKGMYWAWQSGFINMKIEGKSKSSPTRKNQFQFHVGGYLEPNYAMRMIELQVIPYKSQNHNIQLRVDLGKLFSQIELKETNSVMIPGREAMRIADLSIAMFTLK